MGDTPTHEQLLAEYAPPLDPALLLAILSDFPTPLTPADEQAAHTILTSLAKEAETDPDPLEITDQQRTSSPPAGSTGVSVSELSSQLEVSSLSEEGSRSADAGSVSESGRQRPAGQEFWAKSVASATSEEDAAATGAGKLVWEVPDEYVDLAPFPDEGEFAEIGDDPLAFLASVFPDMELSILESRLEGTPYADGSPAPPVDLEQLVEELLSQEIVREIEEEEAQLAAGHTPAPQVDYQTVQSKQDKRRFKAAQKASNSFSLTSTPHLPSPAPAPKNGASHSRNGSNDLSASALFTAPSTSNAWASISSHASYLSNLLYVPDSRVTSTYYAHQSSLPHTLSLLLSQLAQERPFPSLPAALEAKEQLRALVPASSLASKTGAGKEDELETLLCATEGDVSDALDLHSFVQDVQKSMGKNLAWSMLVAPDENGTVEVGKKQPSQNGFPAVASSRRKSPGGTTTTIPLPTSGSHHPNTTYVTPVFSASRNYSAEDCRRLAFEALANRNQAFREAAKAFQRGHGRGVGERGGATVWAEKGRMFERERRRWVEEAARRTVGERRAVTGKDVVDLHGLTLSQALTVVDEACNAWWARSRGTVSPSPLRIITGVGRHSRGGRAILAPAVTRHLDKEGWRWRWDDGPLVAGGVGDGAGRGAVKIIGVR
ncbi:hypothetical protein JCM11641_005635 [Rhodosporidiobolus odoratus]